MSTIPIYIIYKITCVITDTSYIGQTSKKLKQRYKRHISDAKGNSNCVIHKAIRKYGEENFIHEILFETTDQNIINEKEIEYIFEYDTFHNGYNMNEGGGQNYGYKHTVESKEKFSGKNHWNYKKHISNEIKLKLSMSQLGKNNSHYMGDYITPWGIFESSRLAEITGISYHTIQKWCKYSNKIITKASIVKSEYLKSLSESPLGKTFKEIGFGFKPIIIQA